MFTTLNVDWLFLTDVAPTDSTVYPGVCPEEIADYHQSFSWLPFRGYCYLIVSTECEWPNAASSCVRHGKRHSIQRACHSHQYTLRKSCNIYSVIVGIRLFFCEGGVLASIEDPAEQQFLKSNVEIFLDRHSSFWIGLYKTHKGINTLRKISFQKSLLTKISLGKNKSDKPIVKKILYPADQIELN